MRKLKLQVQMSIDGYIADQNGSMDWMVMEWDDALLAYVKEITDPVDCIILGRKLAEVFIPYWQKVAENPEDPEFLAGKTLTDTSKVVFTKTLNHSPWKNTILAKGELMQEINSLKNQEGRDLIAYGGAGLVSSLIKEGLIDEYYFLVDPKAIGEGMAIFKELDSKLNLTLVKSTSFACGIVALHYKPA